MARKKWKSRLPANELICNRCDSGLDPNHIYCYECGEPTEVLRKNLSAFKTIQSTWTNYRTVMSKNYIFAIFYIFILLVPMAIILLNNHSIFTLASTMLNNLSLYLPDSLHDHGLYVVNNLSILIFMPLLLIPFSIKTDQGKGSFSVKGYFSNLKEYPMYFMFLFLNIVYFFLLKIITTSVDPILNLVQLILVLYWLAIIVPMPHLMANKKMNFLKAWWTVYKGGRETRWQQFFILVFSTLINIIGAALLGIGLLVTIPFSIALIEAYYIRMDRYNLFEID